MKKERNGKTIAIAALIIAVIGLSVGFASISTVLNIKGTGRVQSSSFDVHFESLTTTPSKTETTTIVTAPQIQSGSTEISTYDVTFAQPGDYVTYTFNIVNGGTYDAVIETVTVPTPTCTGTGDTATTDAKNVCDYITYTLTYDEDDNKNAIEVGDTLTKQEASKKAKLTLAYDIDKQVTPEKLPKGAVSISNLDVSIKYKQS